MVALRIAVNGLLAKGVLESDPIIAQIAAISCGFVDSTALLDLQYSEDSQAAMDANFIMTPDGGGVEVQATAEDKPLHWDQFMQLKLLADKGISDLATHQLNAISAA